MQTSFCHTINRDKGPLSPTRFLRKCSSFPSFVPMRINTWATTKRLLLRREVAQNREKETRGGGGGENNVLKRRRIEKKKSRKEEKGKKERKITKELAVTGAAHLILADVSIVRLDAAAPNLIHAPSHFGEQRNMYEYQGLAWEAWMKESKAPTAVT